MGGELLHILEIELPDELSPLQEDEPGGTVTTGVPCLTTSSSSRESAEAEITSIQSPLAMHQMPDLWCSQVCICLGGTPVLWCLYVSPGCLQRSVQPQRYWSLNAAHL